MKHDYSTQSRNLHEEICKILKSVFWNNFYPKSECPWIFDRNQVKLFIKCKGAAKTKLIQAVKMEVLV